MRSNLHLIRAALWILMVVFSGFGTRAAQPASPAPVPAPAAEPALDLVTIPKSVFADDPQVGKDPFFPRSTRRAPQVQNVPVVETIPDLLLKGVSGTFTKRLAIINNRTFEVGEEGELKSNGQTVRVKCVEIKDKSVVIRINGSNRELFLSPR
jgi:hypothetical protein